MKRFLVLVVASILVAGLIGSCGGEVGATCFIDPEEVITTTVGQEFVIALDSNPTTYAAPGTSAENTTYKSTDGGATWSKLSTGYNWEVLHEEDMLTLEKEEYTPDKKEPGLVGAGGTQYYHFKALKTGGTVIVVTYKRSWEEGYDDQKVFNVEIK